MEIIGTIKIINDVKMYGTFQKRTIIVTTLEDKYPQDLEIEFLKDKVDLLTSWKVDDIVKIQINLRGREWTNPQTNEVKYFNSIVGWKIEYYTAEKTSVDEHLQNREEVSAEADDLPF